MKRNTRKIISAIIGIAILIIGGQKSSIFTSQNNVTNRNTNEINDNSKYRITEGNVSQTKISESKLLSYRYHGAMVKVINNDKPTFSTLSKKTYIKLSSLDSLGRCGANEMCTYYTALPKTQRGNISSVHPSGWHQMFIKRNGKSSALYNRSHLLMFKLSGLQDDSRNLITGTAQFNQDDGMLSVESQILDYVRQSHNHVMYRVTPVFKGNELVARGVLMEAKSVEDNSLSLCRYVFNVQNGVTIDYATGYARQN